MSKLITAKDGTKRWFNSKGEIHRLDGPAVVDLDGSTHWYVNGKLHRVDGPARELVGFSRSWWLQGKRHRLDGPARETMEGHVEWYVDDIEVTEEEYPQAVLLYKCKMVLES